MPLVCFILVVSKCRLMRFLLKNKQLVVLFKCLFEIIQARCLSFFQVIDKLKSSFSCIQKYGFTIFNSVGIAFSEFQEDEGERTVTIYSPHYWDEIIN